jgi:hypothetical protein
MMDIEFRCSQLVAEGWTDVIISRSPRTKLLDMHNWCMESDIAYYGANKRWVFKEAKHAMMFILKWKQK